MSVIIQTETPQAFNQKLKTKVRLSTSQRWQVDEDGDYTMVSGLWSFHAWMHPIFKDDQLIYAIIGRKNAGLTVEDYAIYHSRFVELLLSKMDKDCDSIETTALGTSYDSFKSANNTDEKLLS